MSPPPPLGALRHTHIHKINPQSCISSRQKAAVTERDVTAPWIHAPASDCVTVCQPHVVKDASGLRGQARLWYSCVGWHRVYFHQMAQYAVSHVWVCDSEQREATDRISASKSDPTFTLSRSWSIPLRIFALSPCPAPWNLSKQLICLSLSDLEL